MFGGALQILEKDLQATSIQKAEDGPASSSLGLAWQLQSLPAMSGWAFSDSDTAANTSFLESLQSHPAMDLDPSAAPREQQSNFKAFWLSRGVPMATAAQMWAQHPEVVQRRESAAVRRQSAKQQRAKASWLRLRKRLKNARVMPKGRLIRRPANLLGAHRVMGQCNKKAADLHPFHVCARIAQIKTLCSMGLCC